MLCASIGNTSFSNTCSYSLTCIFPSISSEFSMEEDNDGDLSLQAADEQVYAYTVVSLLLLLCCNVFCFIIDPTNSSFYLV